ncbi:MULTISPECIES: S26 family signal peptidase [unclassified Novosphingobium]|uniref:S26 family signal peptidase n=1 Tax=unclassified Novosphingobium TaxID=2644732 RepID=UPI000D31DA90|nr:MULTISPECIES: S26 family signal peptidase [unclassified Novosphingobium]PTR12612.1 type IV secretory pathway protease TraF [Novosphingobium sp. GV055]PUB06396.1 type IV secretory pathway protease TraF [Novosphingobium sp. GV061]PUB22447.1 type IV secretory pathway protease TraF [Novosphingobium sp. GV079]PUB44472.1 type IV secretory pathway protease TraF [Novosphingobium sp. GV027]
MFRLAWNAARTVWPEVKLLPLRAAVALGSSGLGQPPRPEQLWKAFGIVLPVGLLTWWAIPQVTLVASPSIDAWVVRAAPGAIARGDLVSFKLSHPLAGPKPVDVTKYALCMPGDRIDMIEKPSPMQPGSWDGWYYCNDKLLGVSKPVGRGRHPLDHWHPASRIIPAGYAYVGSAHRDSFDSRYYGPVLLYRLHRMEKVL